MSKVGHTDIIRLYVAERHPDLFVRTIHGFGNTPNDEQIRIDGLNEAPLISIYPHLGQIYYITAMRHPFWSHIEFSWHDREVFSKIDELLVIARANLPAKLKILIRFTKPTEET